MKKRIFYSIAFSLLLIVSFSNQMVGPTQVKAINSNDVNVLVLVDYAFGANYMTIFNKFKSYGWSYIIAGPNWTLTGCEYTAGEIQCDMLFSQIDNITDYNCVNVMPGNSHVNMLANKDSILDKIHDASDAGVVIAGWCKSVRVLAYADVLNGQNVTGYDDFKNEYTAAGATYISGAAAIISNNIVTTSATQFYLKEMLIAIAQAIGCWEGIAPTLGAFSVQTFENLSRLLIVNILDETYVFEVKAILNAIAPTTGDITVNLLDLNHDDNYSIMLYRTTYGKFSLDIEAQDVFENKQIYTNISTIELGPIPTNSSTTETPNASINILIPIIAFPVIIAFIIGLKKKK